MKKLLSLLVTSVLVTTSAATVLSPISNNQQKLKENYQQNKQLETTWSESKNFENRAFNHSQFKPTGYFLKARCNYLIYLNKKSSNIKLAVGQYERYANLNNNQNVKFTYHKITGEVFWIQPSHSGMLYIADNNETDLEITHITSNTPDAVIKVPTFKVNETNEAAFINEIRTTKAPFIEFKSKHYFATMQTKMILNEVLPSLQRSFNETLLHWDNVWHWTNEIYGLNEKSWFHKKNSQYIHIANADKSVGYANATDGRLMFHNEYGAGKDLFLLPLKDQWGLWHETGHTYQTPQYLWTDLTEVTVNISALYIQEKMNFPLRIFEPERREWLNEYLSKTPYEKDFNSLKGDKALWIKLAMFWQLQMAFGKNFYPLLNQWYREFNQEQNSRERFNTTEKKVQEFVKISSELTGYNLSSFFKHWGLKLTWETEYETSKYKALTQPIWNNIVNFGTEHNPIIQEKIINRKEISNISNITAKNTIINFGEDFTKHETIQKLFNVPNWININNLKIIENTNFRPIKYQNQYYINLTLKLTEPNKRPDFKIFMFKLNLNNTIMFKRAFTEICLGMFGLDSKNNQIKFYGNTLKHASIKPKFKYNIQIKTNTGFLVKNIDIKDTDSFDDIIKKYHLKEGIQYFNNYQIIITPLDDMPFFTPYIFKQNDYQKITGTKRYIIHNNNLIDLS